eukprot:gene3053-2035_t
MYSNKTVQPNTINIKYHKKQHGSNPTASNRQRRNYQPQNHPLKVKEIKTPANTQHTNQITCTTNHVSNLASQHTTYRCITTYKNY